MWTPSFHKSLLESGSSSHPSTAFPTSLFEVVEACAKRCPEARCDTWSAVVLSLQPCPHFNPPSIAQESQEPNNILGLQPTADNLQPNIDEHSSMLQLSTFMKLLSEGLRSECFQPLARGDRGAHREPCKFCGACHGEVPLHSCSLRLSENVQPQPRLQKMSIESLYWLLHDFPTHFFVVQGSTRRKAWIPGGSSVGSLVCLVARSSRPEFTPTHMLA